MHSFSPPHPQSSSLPPPDTRWCHWSLLVMQMSSSTIRQQFQSRNFLWATLIINNSGSRIRSVQVIPAVWGIHPFPTLSSCLAIPSCFHLHVLVISCWFFFSTPTKNYQSIAQQLQKLKLKRTSHYPSRWCANLGLDIKVFQLIIIRGINWRQLSLSHNLATIHDITAEGHEGKPCHEDDKVTHVDRWNVLNGCG